MFQLSFEVWPNRLESSRCRRADVEDDVWFLLLPLQFNIVEGTGLIYGRLWRIPRVYYRLFKARLYAMFPTN